MRNPKDQAFVRSNVLIKKFMFPFLAKFENFSHDMRNGYKLGPEFNGKVRLNKGQLSMLKIVDVQCRRMVWCYAKWKS